MEENDLQRTVSARKNQKYMLDDGTHRALFFDSRFSDYQHGQDQVQNCPLGQPSLEKRGFCWVCLALATGPG